MNSVATKVATSMPPTTPVPIECRLLAPAPLLTASGSLNMGDGVHHNRSRGDTQIVENEVSVSERFGLLVNAARGTLFRNRGDQNLYGIGLYGAADLIGDLESIRGRETTQPIAPSRADSP